MLAWVGPVAAAAGSLVGGLLGNRSSRKESSRNRQFQERMRNTSWQASVADMEAAGINPALAYQQGPAASPGGSMAAQSDYLSGGVSSAMQAMQMRKTLQLMEQQVGTQKAVRTKEEAEAAMVKQRSDYMTKRLNATLRTIDGKQVAVGGDNSLLEDLIDQEILAVRYGASNARSQAERNKALASILAPGARAGGWTDNVMKAIMDQILQAGGGPSTAREFMQYWTKRGNEAYKGR